MSGNGSGEELVRRTLRITSPYGVHAVLPRFIIEAAREVDAKCWIRIDGETAEADKYLQLSAGIPWRNSRFPEIEPFEIEALARGSEAEEFVDRVADFVRHGLLFKVRQVVAALRNTVAGDRGERLREVLNEILEEERVSDENRRKLRSLRDTFRKQFGLVTRCLRLDPEPGHPAQGADWDGEFSWDWEDHPNRDHAMKGHTPDKDVPPPEERDLPEDL